MGRHSCLSAPLPKQETKYVKEHACVAAPWSSSSPSVEGPAGCSTTVHSSPGHKSMGRRILLSAVPSVDSAAGLLLEVPRPCAFWVGQPPFALSKSRLASSLSTAIPKCITSLTSLAQPPPSGVRSSGQNGLNFYGSISIALAPVRRIVWIVGARSVYGGWA